MLQALDRVKSCIDHADPNYRNQLIMVEADVSHVLLELLQDETEAVAVRSASVIAAMTDHCASSKVRLQSGVTALENQSCNILFNPVQDYFLDAIPILVLWTLDFRLIKSDTAHEALGNITSFNKTGKVALIESLCSSIDQGKVGVIELLDRTLAVMDSWEEDMISKLIPRCSIIMDFLKQKQISDINGMIAALGCISTVCEGSSILREDLVENNSLATIMALLLVDKDNESLAYIPLMDAAVNAIWQMSSKGHNKRDIFHALHCIQKEKSVESVEAIAHSLSMVIQAGDVSEHDSVDGDLDSCQESARAQVDYDEEAKKIELIVKTFMNYNLKQGESSCAEENTACHLM